MFHLKCVQWKSVQGKPTLYLYHGSVYLGALFFKEQDACDDFKLQLEAGGDVEFKTATFRPATS